MAAAKDLMYGDKLRSLRGHQVQEWVASQLNITQARLSDYEKGKITFTEEFIRDVCSFFKTPISEFKRAELTPSLQSLLTELERLGMPNEKSGFSGKIVKLLMQRKIRILEKENFELRWKVGQFEAAISRLDKHVDNAIYVIS